MRAGRRTQPTVPGGVGAKRKVARAEVDSRGQFCRRSSHRPRDPPRDEWAGHGKVGDNARRCDPGLPQGCESGGVMLGPRQRHRAIRDDCYAHGRSARRRVRAALEAHDGCRSRWF